MKRKHIKEILLALPFFAVMFYLSAIGFLLPLRPTFSITEKRNLDSFPSFTFSSLASGEYLDRISHWYADTFPGRDSWIDLSNKTCNLRGFKFNYVDTAHIAQSEEIPDTPIDPTIPDPVEESNPQTSTAVASPVPEFSMSEQETEFESMNPDQIDIEMYSGAYKIGDTLFASQGFSTDASARYVSFINSFAEQCSEKGFNAYDVVVPTSVGILLPDETREKIGCADQKKAIDYLFSSISESITCVPVYDILKEHSNEYIYYHSDHHWTGLGAYYAYLAFCESAGFAPVSLDDYTAINEGEFLGSFAATAAQAGGIKRDNVTAYSPPGNVYLLDSEADGWSVADVILDERDGAISNKYNCYIGGDKKLCVIVNDDLGDDAPSCIVIKDSYGNPFSVYLSQHYKNVFVIDYRKISQSIIDYAEQFGVDDIIICQSFGITQSRRANGLLDQALTGIKSYE